MENELVEGIRQAMKKGETLQQAMMSFFNAGYNREEIQNAARQIQMEMNSQNFSQTQNISSQQNSQKSVQQLSKSSTKENQSQVKQSVSSYEEPKKKSKFMEFLTNKITIIILSIILLILIGGLISMLIFREPILDFFAKSFG